MPDPVTRTIEQLTERIRTLEADLEALRKSVDRADDLKEDSS